MRPRRGGSWGALGAVVLAAACTTGVGASDSSDNSLESSNHKTSPQRWAEPAAWSSESRLDLEVDDPYGNSTGNNNTNTSQPEQGSFLQRHGALIGASISVFGNLCISGALNIQKMTHNSIADADATSGADVKKESYLRKPMWWAGILLMVFGELGNFGAYFFAPASLVAPLGTVTVISNAVIAPCCLGETFRRRDAAGVLLAVLGAGVIITCSPQTEPRLTTEELYQHFLKTFFICYASFLVVTGVGAYILLRLGAGKKYVVVPLYVTAVLGSFTVLSVKAVSSLLLASFSGESQFNKPLIYCVALVLVFTAVTQVKFLNYAMQHFDSTVVVPTFFVMFTLGAIMIGAIFYDDFHHLSNDKRGGFVGGVLCTFLGVYLITSLRVPDKDKNNILISETLLADSDAPPPPIEDNGRVRTASGSSLSGISPLLGIETTPLLNRHNGRLSPSSDRRSRLKYVQTSADLNFSRNDEADDSKLLSLN